MFSLPCDIHVEGLTVFSYGLTFKNDIIKGELFKVENKMVRGMQLYNVKRGEC